jgi:UDP-glucose 4-epimerase
MILITGSTGYIGSHLSEFFEKKKIDYVGVDNLSYSYKTNVSNQRKHFFINISNIKAINKILNKYKPETVIHAAAFSYVVEAEKKKKKYFLNNVINTKKFINCCKKHKIKNFLFLSSSNVYKENNNNIGLSELCLTKPKNFYGKNKLEIEKYLKTMKFNNLIILRLFNIIGIFNNNFKIFEFKNVNYQRLIFKIIQNTKINKTTNINHVKNKNKTIFPSRDFLSITRFCKIILKILNLVAKKDNLKKIINVGSGKSTSIQFVIKILKKKLITTKLSYVKLSKKEFVNIKASIKRLVKITNFKQKEDLIKTFYSCYIK